MKPPRPPARSRASSPSGPSALHPFTKLEATGNDFILFDLLESKSRSFPLARPEKIRQLCARKSGIGADGVLLLIPGRNHPFRMRIFNADGSEAEMCGNGLRGLVHYLKTRKMFPGEQVQIETGAGVKTAWVRDRRITVDLGRPQLVPCPLLTVENQKLEIFACTIGNPHAVIFVPRLRNFPVERIGPRIESHPTFPGRTNVEFVEVTGPGELRARVWERGVGETLSCGTGAGAIIFASFSSGRSRRKARVILPGGKLRLEFRRDGLIYLEGPARETFQGMVSAKSR